MAASPDQLESDARDFAIETLKAKIGWIGHRLDNVEAIRALYGNEAAEMYRNENLFEADEMYGTDEAIIGDILRQP